MPQAIRRIVTANDAEGRSFAVFDAQAENTMAIPHRHGVHATQLWVSESMPVRNDGVSDPGALPIILEPPPYGSAVRFVEFPPESAYIGEMDAAKARSGFSAMGADDVSVAGAHPLMHRTRTLDYEIVLSGEIYLILDKSEHLMKAGDIAIQRGTNHARGQPLERALRARLHPARRQSGALAGDAQSLNFMAISIANFSNRIYRFAAASLSIKNGKFNFPGRRLSAGRPCP